MKPRELQSSGLTLLGGISLLALFLFFGLKGCAVTVWRSPNTDESFSARGSDGRTLTLVLLPKNQAMIWRSGPARDHLEGVLVDMRGSYGTHYFWRLWKIEGPGYTFGYRLCPVDAKPVLMEVTVVGRFLSGTSEPELPGVGEVSHQLFLFSPERVRFADMWLTRDLEDPETITWLKGAFGARYPAP